MEFVEESKTLCLKNIIRCQTTLYNTEIDDVISKMITFAHSKNKVKAKRVLTITKGMNFETGKQRIVMDFYLELNQPTKGNNKFVYFDEYIIENCVYTKYIGHPQNANMATREVNEYIERKGLNPIGPVHQVMTIDKKSKKKQKKNEVSLEVYIQVN